MRGDATDAQGIGPGAGGTATASPSRPVAPGGWRAGPSPEKNKAQVLVLPRLGDSRANGADPKSLSI